MLLGLSRFPSEQYGDYLTLNHKLGLSKSVIHTVNLCVPAAYKVLEGHQPTEPPGDRFLYVVDQTWKEVHRKLKTSKWNLF